MGMWHIDLGIGKKEREGEGIRVGGITYAGQNGLDCLAVKLKSAGIFIKHRDLWHNTGRYRRTNSTYATYM